MKLALSKKEAKHVQEAVRVAALDNGEHGDVMATVYYRLTGALTPSPPTHRTVKTTSQEAGFSPAYLILDAQNHTLIGRVDKCEQSGQWWIVVGEDDYAQGESFYTRGHAIKRLVKLFEKRAAKARLAGAQT